MELLSVSGEFIAKEIWAFVEQRVSVSAFFINQMGALLEDVNFRDSLILFCFTKHSAN